MMNTKDGSPVVQGCLGPLTRNLAITGGLFLLAFVATLRTQNGNWFFVIMGGGLLIHWLVWKRLWKERDDAARKRLFGLPDE